MGCGSSTVYVDSQHVLPGNYPERNQIGAKPSINSEAKGRRFSFRSKGSWKKLANLIWKNKETIKSFLEEYRGEGLRRGSIFLSFTTEDRHDADELKKHLEQNHQYEVFICDERDDFDRMQGLIR